jgi:tetratricopeptide (TPR) repeat protein
VPPERAAIERVCSGSTFREAYTDSKGYFSFQVGANNVFGDASTDTPFFGTAAGNLNPGLGGTTQTGSNPLWGCELRANLAGYHSDSISLTNRRSMDNPEIGVIYLTRMLKVEGYTTSATLALAPKDAKKAYERGLNFTKHSKPDEAQAEFLHAVEVYPKLAAAWFELGKVYETRNHLEEARNAYLKATAADGNYVNPYERLYTLALHDTQWKEAADLSEKVLRLNPYEFSNAYYANAFANAQLKNWDAAEKSAREAAQLKGTKATPKSLYLLGVILANKGDFTGSAENLRSYLKTDPLAADRDRTEKMLSQVEQELQAKQSTPAAQ